MRDALLICLKALESLGIAKTTREFAISNAREVLKRDREADRLRFPDIKFNKWLDESITENGEFSVWDDIKCVASAWHGWQNSRDVTKDDAVRAVEARAHPSDEIFVENATEAIKEI